MTTLTVSPLELRPFPVVQVLVDDPPADVNLTVTREPAGDAPVVRGTPTSLPAAGAWLGFDVEAPFGSDLTYTATLTDPTTGAVVETLTATTPGLPALSGVVVSDPLSGRAVLVTLQDENGAGARPRASRVDLSGVRQPLWLTDVRASWEWTDVLVTHTRSDWETLDALLAPGTPVLLRLGDPACGLREGYVMVGEVSEERLGVRGGDPARRWFLALAEADGPSSTVEPAVVTLQDMHEWTPTTLLDLSARDTTLLGLSLGTADYVGALSAA